MTRLSFFPLYVLARLVQQPLSTSWYGLLAPAHIAKAGNISAE